MKNSISTFEIPVNDLDRAIHFYQQVFGYELERVTIFTLMKFISLLERSHKFCGIRDRRTV